MSLTLTHATVTYTTQVQFLCYEGTFTATSGAASGATCTDIGVAEAGNAPINSSLQLIGTGCTYSDFTVSTVVLMVAHH